MYIDIVIVYFFLFYNVSSFYTNNGLNYATKSFLTMKKTKTSLPGLCFPKTPNQQKYVQYLDDENSKIIVSLGPAGTGKTMFACQKAISQMKSEEINKIIITRPVVTVEEEIGFLPGNIIKKMDPWTKPIFDIFLEFFTKTDLDLMLYNNKIEICPLAFMRGRTFKNAFIIADEMQNSSPNQMKMLVSRLGDNSRLAITGDLQQSDIKGDNGLHDFISKFKKHQSNHNATELIRLVHFDNVDIERSDVVKKVIEIYDFKEPAEKVKEPEKETAEKVKEKELPKKTVIPLLKGNGASNTDGDAALIPFHHYYKF